MLNAILNQIYDLDFALIWYFYQICGNPEFWILHYLHIGSTLHLRDVYCFGLF